LDFIAMDIKNQLKNYDKTTGGAKVDKDRIKLSVDLIKNSKVPYEFRTTVVPGIHTEKDFTAIAKWIGGAENYYLQEYRELKILNSTLKKKTTGKKIDLEKIKAGLRGSFQKIGIRK
jgi:pyruvate formate lyase activating enzyme